jgi:hypothetical protein
MMRSFTDLVTTIETELRIGEQLLHNIVAQKAAILNWNAAQLLEGLSEKELLLHKLQATATQQSALLSHSECPSQEQPSRLLEVLAQLPTGPERAAILQLQLQVCDVYSSLQTEEHKLVSLLENMLGHTHEMLHALEPPSVSVYGRSGTTSVSHPEPELLQEKA